MSSPSSSADREAALDVWLAARTAAGEPPSAARVTRVREKLTDDDAVLVVVRRDAAVVGMALAEPFRGDPAAGHVSMVFVRPDRQRDGVGRELMEGVHARGWRRTSLWTRETNAAARGLYAACGYRPSTETDLLPSGEVIRRWERRAPAPR